MPNIELCQRGRKEEALRLSLQSTAPSVRQFTATTACRWTSFCAKRNKCFVLLISKVATYSYRTDAQDLNSDQQGNLGQRSADPANFYQFKLCFKSHCKASVRKRITSGYPTRRGVLIFFFFKYTIGLCSSIVNHLGKFKEEVILILPCVQVEFGFQSAA